MGYVLAETALLLALALLLGVLVGWLLWGWRRAGVSETKYLELLTERDELRRSYVNRASGASVPESRPTAPVPAPSPATPDIDLTTPHAPATPEPRPVEKPSSSDLDDLTLIDGIDDGFARFLNGNDISTYRHLGSLTEDEIDRLQALLPGKANRIRDDDWVGGARRLYNEKYGQLRTND